MTTASAKAKGRNLQKLVCKALLEVGSSYGLEEGDITSRSMGANGVDVILSPAAQKIFGTLALECKNVEKLNVIQAYKEHSRKYPDSFPVLVHKRNGADPLCTMSLKDFMSMYDALLVLKNTGGNVNGVKVQLGKT